MADRVEDGVSWWVGVDRAEFARRLAREQSRIQALDISPTAARMASHELTRAQRRKRLQALEAERMEEV